MAQAERVDQRSASRIDRRRERNRSYLCQAAKAAFAKHGYTRTSVQRIIDEADITRATFYSYFRSKDGVFGELLDELIDELCDCVNVATEDRSVRNRIRARTSAMLDVSHRNRDFIAAVDEAIHVSPDHARRWMRLKSVFEDDHRAAIAWCVRHGIVAPTDVRAVSRILSGISEAALLDAARSDADEPDTVERIVTDIYWNTLFRPAAGADDYVLSDDGSPPRAVYN